MRISFYVPEQCLPINAHGDLITRSGTTPTIHTVALHRDLFFGGYEGLEVQIPALGLVGRPTEYVVEDTGSFEDQGAIDIFLPDEDPWEVMDRLSEICQIINGHCYVPVKVFMHRKGELP